MLLLLATYPVFSLTKEVVVFAIIVGICVFAIVFIDLMYGPNPPVEKDENDTELFTKIEEYRNDFPDAR